jgi:hypothetical protein
LWFDRKLYVTEGKLWKRRSQWPPGLRLVGSNPTQGIDGCLRLFCVCVVPYR